MTLVLERKSQPLQAGFEWYDHHDADEDADSIVGYQEGEDLRHPSTTSRGKEEGDRYRQNAGDDE